MTPWIIAAVLYVLGAVLMMGNTGHALKEKSGTGMIVGATSLVILWPVAAFIVARREVRQEGSEDGNA